MTYNELIELLLSPNVYDCIRKREKEIFALIPELKVCKGFDQKNSWHIYDVYEHILHVVSGVDAVQSLRLVALFHDVGKPSVFKLDAEGIGHFFGHWDYSVEIFRKYAPLLGLSQEDNDLIEALIFYHDVNLDKMDDAALTEMVKRIGKEHMTLLFAIKRADLLAQSSVYHGLLSNIQKQEERVGRLSI